MAGGLKSLRFWKKGAKGEQRVTTDEKALPPRAEVTQTPEKPSPEAKAIRVPPTTRGVPIRPDVNPAYSAYSTPVDTRWADRAPATAARNSSDAGSRAKEDGVSEEEAARRRKAEQEEQERLDFFQMM